MNVIDIHTHGIGGYDTRTTRAEDILRMAELHGAHGVSAILPTIYPSAVEEMRKDMLAVKQAMDLQRQGYLGSTSVSEPAGANGEESATDSGSMGATVFAPRPALILGVHLEGPFLNPSRCGALDPAAFVQPSEYGFRRLTDGFESMIRIITIAPELDSALSLIGAAADRGIVVSMGHSDATFAEADAGFHRGARGITHLFNAMRGIHQREPGIAGFGLLNPGVYVEIIADPHHLHLRTVELIFRMKGSERIVIVSDSVKESKTSLGQEAITVKHGGGLAGGTMTVTEAQTRLLAAALDEKAVIRAVTLNPSRYLVAETSAG